MQPEEIDVVLEDVEVRLERLRALYEQYFMGFEKIEPSVARKDVDRRIYALRREKIRNTARRFKLQTIIQRYNTFQQYWQRICREIENGTYKRHVARAERLVGPSALLTVASRRRFGKERQVAREQGVLHERDEQAESAAAPEARTAEPAAEKAPEREQAAPPASAPPRKERPSRPSDRGHAYERLELDMDFMGDWDPEKGAARRGARRPHPGGPRSAKPQPRTTPGAAKPRSSPRAAPAPAPPAAAAAPAFPPAVAPAQKPGPPPPPRRSPPQAAPPEPRPPRAAESAGQDAKLQALHAKLSGASPKPISMESLKKSLSETESRLRARYPNRPIDFVVVLKDGKPVLKPIVR